MEGIVQMLTPLDIHNKEFKRSLRGYEIDEVDIFLDDVIRDFEDLYKENLELKEAIQKLEENINHYKDLEKTLQNTMVLAQQTADEAKQNATKEAELITWEAEKKAEQMVNDAQKRAEQITNDAQKRAEQMLSDSQSEVFKGNRKVEELKGFEKQIYLKMKSFLTTQLELMSNYNLEKKEEDIIIHEVVDNHTVDNNYVVDNNYEADDNYEVDNNYEDDHHQEIDDQEIALEEDDHLYESQGS